MCAPCALHHRSIALSSGSSASSPSPSTPHPPVSVARVEGPPLVALLRLLCTVELAQPEETWALFVDPRDADAQHRTRRLHRAACEQARDGRGACPDTPLDGFDAATVRRFLAALGYRCSEDGAPTASGVIRFVGWEGRGDTIVVFARVSDARRGLRGRRRSR